VGLLAVLTIVATLPATAHPPQYPDHGVPPDTFYTLWSGDSDAPQESASARSGSPRPLRVVANRTDIPLDRPPKAVETWNDGDHQEFPPTNRTISIYPPEAPRESGRFIKEASVSIFSLGPSTEARLSPSSDPRYAAPSGTVRGVADYRVEVPSDQESDLRRVNWTLGDHRINRTTVLVDGEAVNATNGTHTPVLAYRLEGMAGETHTITLRLRATAELRKEIAVCRERSESDGCLDWDRHVTTLRENVTVHENHTVVKYDPQMSASVARYPDGDVGLVVYQNQPWLGYRLPNGDVRGVWRFYSARDPQWDTLIHSTATRGKQIHSPLHPLRIFAYPISTGPTPTPRGKVSILDIYGPERRAPSLPDVVNLDVIDGTYTASFGIASRAEAADVSRVSALGLVRGVNTARSTEGLARVDIDRTRLTLDVVTETNDSITVRAHLRTEGSGVPINTTAKGGYIVVGGERVNTTGTGTIRETVPKSPSRTITARYVPGEWWLEGHGYTADSAAVSIGGPQLQVASTLYTLGVAVGLSLVAVFLLDRVTPAQLWPPWRRL